MRAILRQACVTENGGQYHMRYDSNRHLNFLSSPMHIFHSFITEATSSVKQEMCGNEVLYSTAQRKCDVLCHLVPFVEFRKRKKHPRRSVTFSKFCRLKPVTLLQHSFIDVFHIFKIIQIVPNSAERLEYFPKTRSASCF